MRGAIEQLAAILGQAHGLDVSALDEDFLARAMGKRVEELGLADGSVYLDRLRDDREEALAFQQSLRVGYSEFFRDPLAFAIVEQMLLPRLMLAAPPGREIRVWSAGCASGEEAYSVAILLEETTRPRETAIPYRVFATDHRPDALTAARDGWYEERAVAKVRLGLSRKYFSRVGDGYQVVPALRERLSFSTHDLVESNTSSPPASIYGDFDLILCCNLLFYYRDPWRRTILEKLHRSLAPGGYLVTGEAESPLARNLGIFRPVGPATTVFQKG